MRELLHFRNVHLEAFLLGDIYWLTKKWKHESVVIACIVLSFLCEKSTQKMKKMNCVICVGSKYSECTKVELKSKISFRCGLV